MRPDGTAQKRVVLLPTSQQNFTLSARFTPDANSILYGVTDPFHTSDPGMVWAVGADGSGQRLLGSDLSTPVASAFPAISPDSKTVGYFKHLSPKFKRVELSTGTSLDSGASNVVTLFKTKDQVLTSVNGKLSFEPFAGGVSTELFSPPAGANLWEVSPSPDRSRIALRYHYFNGMSIGMPMDEVWMIYADGRSPAKLETALSPEFFASYTLRWSSDSRTFAYQVTGLSSGNGLYILAPGATSARRILSKNSLAAFSLSPEGSYLAYHPTATDPLHLVRIDGTGDVTISGVPGLTVDWGW